MKERWKWLLVVLILCADLIVIWRLVYVSGPFPSEIQCSECHPRVNAKPFPMGLHLP